MLCVYIGNNKRKVKKEEVGRIISRTISSSKWGHSSLSFIKVEGGEEKEIILAPRGARITNEVKKLVDDGKTVIILPSSTHFS
ncbi:MAG: hypothetical protein KatS3mg098_455 [Candidatus Parcubacteria bacterium]|nr:hypothetical protein [Patescibacteria group bacterium]BCX16226.1 MAG: hypothetical protein KatS3mg098_455 [Candidatus Parcubacteria bacterium]